MHRPTNCPNCGAALPKSRVCEHCGTDCREEKPGGVTLCGKQIGTLVPPKLPAEVIQKIAAAGLSKWSKPDPGKTIKPPDYGTVVVIEGNKNKVKF